MKTVTFYHDIEQDVNVEADIGACRAALQSLLAVEAAHGIRTTYNVVGTLWKAQPDIVEWIREGGHEVAFHSYHHDFDCPPERFHDEVRLCREHAPGIQGYRSPRSRWNEDTLRSCWEHDFTWNAESDRASEPYFIYEQLVRLPIAGDDWSLHMGVLESHEWIDRFRQYLVERDYVAIGVHDCVVSHRPSELLATWEQCVDIATDAGARIIPFGGAAQALLTKTGPAPSA